MLIETALLKPRIDFHGEEVKHILAKINNNKHLKILPAIRQEKPSIVQNNKSEINNIII